MIVTQSVRAAVLGAGLAALMGAAPMAATAGAPTKATTATMVEPVAVSALARMSAYLRGNHTFQVSLATQRDEVDAYGQLLTFTGQAIYKVRLPNAFSIDVTDGAETRQYFYDGKSVTMFDPQTGFYAHFNAPGTVRATLDAAEERYGIALPLRDLFDWQSGDQAARLTAAHYVGPAIVAGQKADQYAFRQAGVDWQIWIASGDRPLPLRVVIVASHDPARPQFEADLTWNLAPQFAANTFTFTPPQRAKPIPIKTAAE